MLNGIPIFAELFGLAVFDLDKLSQFQQDHNLEEDLLEVFTSSDLGDQALQEGVVIPLLNIPGDYYYLSVSDLEKESPYLKNNQIIIKSNGWVINSSTGILHVMGIGYLKKFNRDVVLKNKKFIQFNVVPGWYEVEIVGGVDEDEKLVYEFNLKRTANKPLFSGDFQDNFNIVD